jgi:hypothetical protein
MSKNEAGQCVCDREGCGREGKWNPVFKVWAKGYSREEHPPLEGKIGIVVCDEFLPEEVRENIRDTLSEMGRAEPDFSYIKVDFIPVGDDEDDEAPGPGEKLH